MTVNRGPTPVGRDRQAGWAQPLPARFAAGRVQAARFLDACWQQVQVETAPAEPLRPALHDVRLLGPVNVGDRVILNTTAVDLELGTGGLDFVVWVMGAEARLAAGGPARGREAGHVMKLRYSPLQRRVLAVEETGHPLSGSLAAGIDLEGMPVVLLGLHSHLAPALAGLRVGLGGAAPIAYVMTDGGALPAGISRILRHLREQGHLDVVITAGHAYGGDLEAVHPLSGLLAARHAVGARAAILGVGPGLVGTGTPAGTTAVEQAALSDLAAAAGGISIPVLRLSFRDPRVRHQGLSHHSRRVFRLAGRAALLAVPRLEGAHEARVWGDLRKAGALSRHAAVTVNGEPGLDHLQRWGLEPESMGRTSGDDPAFFLAAAAAGLLAGRMAAGEGTVEGT